MVLPVKMSLLIEITSKWFSDVRIWVNEPRRPDREFYLNFAYNTG